MDATRKILPALLLLAMLVPQFQACSDSPEDVVEDLGDHAKRRLLVQFRSCFSTRSREVLRRQFAEDGLEEDEGWKDLMEGYLGKDRTPPDILSDQTQETGETAVVTVSRKITPPPGSKTPAQIITQPLTLVLENDEWKLELSRIQYEVTAEKDEKEDGEEKKQELDTEEEPELEFGEKKAEKVEDIDLDDF